MFKTSPRCQDQLQGSVHPRKFSPGQERSMTAEIKK